MFQFLCIRNLKNATTFIQCYHAEMESRGPEDSKNVKTSQAYFFEGFISFFEDFSLTIYYRAEIIFSVKYFLIKSIYSFTVSM